MYEELINKLRELPHLLFVQLGEHENVVYQAADAIEELLKAAISMHTWIFLNSGDEQNAYDECGLTDEMNVALGYGGQFIVEQTKGES